MVSNSTQLSTSQRNNITLVTINDFLFDSKIDMINLADLLSFMQSSKISRKLSGFISWSTNTSLLPDVQHSALQQMLHMTENHIKLEHHKCRESFIVNKTENEKTYLSPLVIVESFLKVVTGTNNESGRIALEFDDSLPDDSCIARFLLLNPATKFAGNSYCTSCSVCCHINNTNLIFAIF